GRRSSPAFLGLLDIQFNFRFRLRLRFFWHGDPHSKWIEYICPKACIARRGLAITRRKDRYQLRVASASQPKTLKTYACAALTHVASWHLTDMPQRPLSGRYGVNSGQDIDPDVTGRV